MRVVALVSGGKDSTYNMMQVTAEGHQVIALANLHPKDKDELDSYMYQTVGHQGIEKLAQAMELPLYRKITRGNSINKKGNYEPTEDDEVEDLYELLRQVKEEQNVEAVAVGAILSDYQRVRVENVCNRLKLISLAYLWRRDQTELLQEMIDCQVYAIIIKVAALGLIPDRHLGKSLKEMQPHLLNMKEKYGLNVCGEGGEYETFTLDCPLFKSRIVVDDVQTVISSADPVCPVGYLNFTKLRLVPKERVETVIIKNSLDFIADLNESSYSDLSDPDLSESELELIEKVNNAKTVNMRNSFSKDDLSGIDGPVGMSRSNSITKDLTTELVLPKSPVRIITKRLSIDGNSSGNSGNGECAKLVFEHEKQPLTNQPRAIVNSKGWMWVAGVQGVAESSNQAMEIALKTLEDLITSHSFTLRQICYITLYVREMAQYPSLDVIYSKMFGFTNPPTRVCVECPLPDNCHVVLEAVAFNSEKSIAELEHKRHTMHVQGISHWAPANIGTYSQSTKVGHITYISGQIALVPGSMTIIEGGIKQQCKLTLRHVSRIAKAMHAQGLLRDVVQGICFVTHPSYIYEARRQWERRSANAIMDYIVVPALPRGALVEWQVWAHTHNDKFDYEETGCSIGDYTISIRRRWNYENNCASVVCYVSTGLATSTTKLTELSDDFLQHHNQLAQAISREQIHDAIAYVLRKLLQDYPLGNSPSNESNSSLSDDQQQQGAPNDNHNQHHHHHHHPQYHHSSSSSKPTVHLRFFYQVSVIGSVQSLLEAIESFLSSPSNVARIAYTVVPACHLQNFSTFISICGLRHHE
uniref:Diphthine--ammonia ligase n=1 Tax=Psorophora albipes TaxID=869069 RepID=T1DDZ8_9DIPT